MNEPTREQSEMMWTELQRLLEEKERLDEQIAECEKALGLFGTAERP